MQVKGAFAGNKVRLQHSLSSQRHRRASFKPCAAGASLAHPVQTFFSALLRQLTLSVCHAASVVSRETVTSKVSDARLEELGVKDLAQDKWNRSYYPTLQDTVAVHKPWYLIDAEGQTLGRLAVLAATVLRQVSTPIPIAEPSRACMQLLCCLLSSHIFPRCIATLMQCAWADQSLYQSAVNLSKCIHQV